MELHRGGRHRDRDLLPAAVGRAVDLLRRRRPRFRLCALRRHDPESAAWRPSRLASVLRRAPRTGRGRRDLRRLRGAVESRATEPVGRRRLLPRRLSVARTRRVPRAAASRRAGQPCRCTRHRRRLLRRGACAVGLLHRSLQPHSLRKRRHAAGLDGVSGDGRAAPRRIRAATRQARWAHGRLHPAARERRPVGGRRRDLRAEHRDVPRR
jgi:hypothetical protein